MSRYAGVLVHAVCICGVADGGNTCKPELKMRERRAWWSRSRPRGSDQELEVEVELEVGFLETHLLLRVGLKMVISEAFSFDLAINPVRAALIKSGDFTQLSIRYYYASMTAARDTSPRLLSITLKSVHDQRYSP